MGLWVDKLIGWFNHFFITKFDECWIPDAGGSINLAGELSHGDLPDNAVYIGPLSRFSMNSDKTPGLTTRPFYPVRNHSEVFWKRSSKNSYLLIPVKYAS